MTNVLVCIKRVPDAAGEVTLTADDQAVDARYVGFTISAHENCAVELAVRIAVGHGWDGDRADPRHGRRGRAAADRAGRWAARRRC